METNGTQLDDQTLANIKVPKVSLKNDCATGCSRRGGHIVYFDYDGVNAYEWAQGLKRIRS